MYTQRKAYNESRISTQEAELRAALHGPKPEYTEEKPIPAYNQLSSSQEAAIKEILAKHKTWKDITLGNFDPILKKILEICFGHDLCFDIRYSFKLVPVPNGLILTEIPLANERVSLISDGDSSKSYLERIRPVDSVTVGISRESPIAEMLNLLTQVLRADIEENIIYFELIDDESRIRIRYDRDYRVREN